jgi:hypothetical protein
MVHDLVRLIAVQLVKKFPVLVGAISFITVLKKSENLTLF